MLRLLILLFCHASIEYSIAQNHSNYWFFGEKAGLVFSSDPPQPIINNNIYSAGGFHNQEGSSVLCDSSGNLLFYSDGEFLWNRLHVITPNGYGLLGHKSSGQNSIFVPKPGNDTLFYLFTTDAFVNNYSNGLNFSVLNICLENGDGDIETGMKNIHLLDTASEKMCVIARDFEESYWLIVYKQFTGEFYSFKIDTNGVNLPVISVTPVILGQNNNDGIGQMKVSPAGNYLAAVGGQSGNRYAYLFSFDINSGIVSNPQNILVNSAGILYGLSFSPDGSKFYYSRRPTFPPSYIYQFDLLSGNGDPDSIFNSKIDIILNNSSAMGMQLASNGKIYVSSDITNSISIIENPNLQGLSCGFVENQIALLAGSVVYYGFPSFIENHKYYFNDVSCFPDVVSLENKDRFFIYPNPVVNGTITIENYSGNVIDIFSITGEIISTHRLNKGINKVEVNLAQGTYLYKISDTDRIVRSGPLIVIN